MEAHGWSLGGARPRWGSPRRARAAAAPRPGTAPSSAPPRSRPPTRWPDAGPPTRAACGRRGYARSSRERERESSAAPGCRVGRKRRRLRRSKIQSDAKRRPHQDHSQNHRENCKQQMKAT